MNENVQPPASGIRLPPAGSAPAKPRQISADGGVAFRALLERLEAQAEKLADSSQKVEDAKALERAMDIARASLSDALTLSDRLLEAFREEQYKSKAIQEKESGPR